MIARRRLSTLVFLSALIFGLGYLFNKTQAVDIEAQNRVMLNLRELEKLDAGWNAGILHSHIGRKLDHAPMPSPLPRMRELQRQLAAALPMVKNPEAVRVFNALSVSLQEKERLVEQFKTQNAILHTSLRYLPTELTDLKTELTGIEGALVPSRTVLALDAALNSLLSDILRYNLTPMPALAARIEQTIETMLDLRVPFSYSTVTTVEELARHGRTILKYRQLENALEARIANTRTAESMERLGTLFDRSFDQEQLDRQRHRSFLFAYSGLLLALLIYAAWRLRRSYRVIGVVNRSLQAANETLEQRVAERTAALEAQTERLEQLARHDGLTGLINYGQLTRLLEHALLRAERRNNTVVVMFIDLDGFKAVNDTYGHATGDLVLKEVARRVSEKLRKEDALARLGGDEFVILLEEVIGREGALRVAQQTLEEIRSITDAGGNPVRISASIGISSATGRDDVRRGSAALLAEADQAMYRAKEAGKNGIAVSPRAHWGVNSVTASAL